MKKFKFCYEFVWDVGVIFYVYGLDVIWFNGVEM